MAVTPCQTMRGHALERVGAGGVEGNFSRRASVSFYANMYQDKLCKPADAAKLVEDGKNLVMGMGAAMPPC